MASRTAPSTLPWSWYSDPALLRREQELIFRRAWQYAGPAEHVESPGDFFTCRVGDVPVVVERTSTYLDYFFVKDGPQTEAEIEELMPESEKLIAHFQGLVREALG